LANPYHSEATSLVRSRWPEATRPVGEMKFCYCGGKYDGGQCQRDDCPRARLGHGAWHVALPKLQELMSKGQLENRYPDLNLYDLQNHVKRTGQKHHEEREHHRDRKARISTHERREKAQDRGCRREEPPEVHLSESEKSHLRAIIRGREEQPKCHLFSGSERSEKKRTWRKPRQPEGPPPNVASSCSGGNPVKREPVAVDSDGADGDGVGYDSEFTVLDSDESGASIFGLRSAIHEVEEGDELSDASSQGDDEMAVAERERVNRWRTGN
jgi:hypothetical protein